MEESLIQNDNSFIKEINNANLPENNELNEQLQDIYNPALFQQEDIIKFFQMKGILKNSFNCSIYGKIYKFVKENQTIDKYIWRCRGSYPSNDIKINIRRNSILENMHLNIQILYYLFFYCFTEKKTINESLIETSKFAEALGISGIPNQYICNIFAILRGKIKENMHNNLS